MTDPTNPPTGDTGDTPAPPPPTTPPDVTQQAADAAAAQQQADQTGEIRDLATEIQQPALPFDPATMRKGTVTAVNLGDPPTLSIQLSGDTSETIAGVRYLDSYSPLVGDIVILIKQGTDVLAIGRVAQTSVSGWITPSLASGFTGTVKYRKVWDSGSWKVQWRGIANRSSGTTIIAGLPADVRPTELISMLASRDSNHNQVAVKIEITTGGAVTMVDGTISATTTSQSVATTTGASSTTTSNSSITSTSNESPVSGGPSVNSTSNEVPLSGGSNQPNTGFTVAGGTNHQHTMGHEHAVSHGHTLSAHTHQVTHGHTFGHTHTLTHTHDFGHTHDTSVSAPTIIFFNGLEYFI